MVKLVRFTPTATVNEAKPNDIIRFQLLGNGFFDPYSAYIRIEVSVNMAELQTTYSSTSDDEGQFIGRFLDRSAHSFISRLVVKSQGTELERIEQYDIAAAMINDTLYDNQQCVFHHYEGFPTRTIDLSGNAFNAYADIVDGAGTKNMGLIPLMFLPTLNQSLQLQNVIDQGFWKLYCPSSVSAANSFLRETTGANIFTGGMLWTPTTALSYTAPFVGGSQVSSFGNYANYMRSTGYIADSLVDVDDGTDGMATSPSTLVFCIPIYSGILGVLMPEKKMLPLSLMPLEVEFTVNPYALYCVGSGVTPLDGSTVIGTLRDTNPRAFTITKFWLYSHVLSFEQELHRSLESVVAENGIFIHFNSFYLAPIATHYQLSVQNYAQINIHAKSINSIHFVFIYTGYENANGPRKLNFSNHNLSFLQIRNGTDLMPSEAIIGDQMSGKPKGEHAQFYLETMKAWNKMHDPTTDCAFTPFNYTFDQQIQKPTNFYDMIWQQSQLGRCQYAISLEGEELSMDKTIITGRKGLIPFDINMSNATKSVNATSFQYIFVKADYLIYVRPDLVVTLLGR